MANFPTSGFATNFDDLPPLEDEFEGLVVNGQEVGELAGWRLEKRSDGYFRYRWQKKDASGKPMTYVTETGKVGYARGSKYVGKKAV